MRLNVATVLSFNGGCVDTAGFLALQGLFTARVLRGAAPKAALFFIRFRMGCFAVPALAGIAAAMMEKEGAAHG